MVALNPDRVRHLPTIGEVLRLVHGRVDETQDTMADLQTTALADRVVDPDAGDWSPEVWLINAAADDDKLEAMEQVLVEVAAAGRSTVAVVARAAEFAPAGGSVIDVDADGTLSLPALLGEQRVHAWQGWTPKRSAGCWNCSIPPGSSSNPGRFQDPTPGLRE